LLATVAGLLRFARSALGSETMAVFSQWVAAARINDAFPVRHEVAAARSNHRISWQAARVKMQGGGTCSPHRGHCIPF